MHMRVFKTAGSHPKQALLWPSVNSYDSSRGVVCSNKNRTACGMAKPQSTEKAHLARPLNVRLAGCHLEGSPLGPLQQVTPAAFLRKVRTDGFWDAAFISKSGHLAVFLFILSVCGKSQHRFSCTQQDKREARGQLRKLGSLCWRWGEDADWTHLLGILMISK